MNISAANKRLATDLGLSVLYVFFTFSILRYFTITQALVGVLLAGFVLGYIRRGKEGKTVKNAALVSAVNLLMAVFMLFQWPHFILFVTSFLAVYWGMVVEMKYKEPKKRVLIILSTLLPAIFLASFAFPKFITAQLTSEGTGKVARGEFLNTDSSAVSIEDFSGKIIVMDFWATWCNPCLNEMDAIADHYASLDTAGVELLFINAGSKRETFTNFKNFTDSTAYPFHFYYDTEGSYTKQNQVSAFPTILLVDTDGAIQYRHTGFYDGEDIVGYLNDKIETIRKKSNDLKRENPN